AGYRLEGVARRVAGAVYIIDAARLILRVIEDVEGLKAELDGVVFMEGKALVGGQVEIVDRAYWQRVAAGSGQSASSGLDVISIWVDGRISDGCPSGIGDGCNASASSLYTVWIDHGAVDGGAAVAVEVGVYAGENGGVLRRFVGVDGRDGPVADEVLHHKAVGVFVERESVEHLE